MVGSRPVLRSVKMASDDEFKINDKNKNNLWVRKFDEKTSSNNNEISGSKSTEEECRTKLLDPKDMELFGSCPYDGDVYLVSCSCYKLFHLQTFKSRQNNHKCLTETSSKTDNKKLQVIQSTNQSKRDPKQQKNAKNQKANAKRCNIKNTEKFYEHQSSSHYITENGIYPESKETISLNGYPGKNCKEGVDLSQCEYSIINKISEEKLVKQQNSRKPSKRGRKPGKSKNQNFHTTKIFFSNGSNLVENNEESIDPKTTENLELMNGSSPQADSAYGSEKSANCPSNSPSTCEISRSEQKSEICNSQIIFCEFQNASHLEIQNYPENKEEAYSKCFPKRKNDSPENMDEGRKKNKCIPDNHELENFSTYSDSCYQPEKFDRVQSLACDYTEVSISSCDPQEGGNLQNLSSDTKENKLLPNSTENFFSCDQTDSGQSEEPLLFRTDSDNVNQTCASSSIFQNSSEELEQMDVFLDKTSESSEKLPNNSDTDDALEAESRLPCSSSFLEERTMDEGEKEDESEIEDEEVSSSCSSSDSSEENSSSDESSSNEDRLYSVKSRLFPPTSRVLMKGKKFSKYGTMLLKDSVPQFKLGGVINTIMETEKPGTSKPETPAVTTCHTGVLTDENSPKDDYPLCSNCRNEDRTPSKSLFQNRKYAPYSYLFDSINRSISSKQINSSTVINKQFNQPFENAPADSCSSTNSIKKNCIKVKVNGLFNHSPDKV